MGYKKGQSGNPGGRPKEAAEVKALALEYSMPAIERLIELMKCDDPKIAFHAANAVLDRGIGKPSQAVEVSGKDGIPLVPVLNIGKKP